VIDELNLFVGLLLSAGISASHLIGDLASFL